MSELSELEKLDIEMPEQEAAVTEMPESAGGAATETEAAATLEPAGAEGVAEPAEVSESEVAETPAETSEAVESAEGEAQEEAAPQAFDADAYLEQLAEAKRSITAGIVIYKGRINEKLQERSQEGYDAVAAIVNEPQYDRVAQYDQELTIFKSTGAIYQMEAGTEPLTIYDHIEYMDEYRRIHEQMMFFLRRMQFGLDYSDCMMWLDQWGLSVHFVVQLLLESDLGEKGRIALILADMYERAGKKKEAVYLLNMIKEHCLEEEEPDIWKAIEILQGAEA